MTLKSFNYVIYLTFSFILCCLAINSNIYVTLFNIKPDSLTSEDKYRLISFSPINITGILREKAKEMKDNIYISNQLDTAGPPIVDTAFTVHIDRWSL